MQVTWGHRPPPTAHCPPRVIGMDPHQLVTTELHHNLPVDPSGAIQPDLANDILKLVSDPSLADKPVRPPQGAARHEETLI